MSSFIRRRSLSRLAAGAVAIALTAPGLVTMMSGQAVSSAVAILLLGRDSTIGA